MFCAKKLYAIKGAVKQHYITVCYQNTAHFLAASWCQVEVLEKNILHNWCRVSHRPEDILLSLIIQSFDILHRTHDPCRSILYTTIKRA